MAMMKAPFKRLVLLYAVAAGCWLAFAHVVVAPAVEAAYRERAHPLLNRLLAGRTRHPLAHYLDLWGAASGAALLGLGAHGLVVAAARRRAAPIGPIAALAALFLTAAALSGPRQDYAAFLEIWDATRRGVDPWWVHPRWGYPLNAYGPLFNALAPLAWVNPLAPKLLTALAYLLFVVDFLGRVASRRAGVIALAYLFGPYFWVEIAYYGHLDVLVALACVFAVRARLGGRDLASGVLLGLGVLLKFLPVVLLPALMFEGRRPRIRVALGAAGVIVGGLAISVAAWGASTFRPLAFAAARGPALLSIFRFLAGRYSPLRPVLDPAALARSHAPILAIALLAVALVGFRRRADASTSAVAAALATTLAYKVGFPQYQMLLFLLLPDWAALHRRTPATDRPLGLAACAYLGWISAFDVLYAAAGGVLTPGHPWYWLDEVVGLPTFVLGGALLVGLLSNRGARRRGLPGHRPGEAPRPPAPCRKMP